MPAGIVQPPVAEAEAIRAFLQEERIASGARLLDVPRGIGRRAVGLAQAGYRVTAADPNEEAIAAAKGRVARAIVGRLAFMTAPREQLPGLPPETTFDAILCLDHALGRGPATEDVALPRRLTTHIRPEVLLLLELLNRDFFASQHRPFACHTIRSVEQHEFRSFDLATNVLRIEWKFYERVGKDLKLRTESSSELLSSRLGMCPPSWDNRAGRCLALGVDGGESR